MVQLTNILIVTRDPEVARLDVRLQFEGLRGWQVDSYSAAVEALGRIGKCVALIDGDMPDAETFRIYGLLHEERVIPTLMLMPGDSYYHVIQDPHRNPIDDAVQKPARIEELVLRLKALILRAGYDLPSRRTAAAPEQMEENPDRQGQIIVLFSVKGGVGKSTIAVNLAEGLARLANVKTLLVDGDLWFGDVGVLLNIDSNRSIFDACDLFAEDRTMLAEAMEQRGKNLSVLLRPPDLVTVERMDVGAVLNVIAACRSFFDFVVVDTQSALDELTLQVLDLADQILLVTTPEMAATAAALRFLSVADTLDYTSKLALVVNRANSGIQTDNLERKLGIPVKAKITSAGMFILQANNEGRSVFEKDPEYREQMTQDIIQLVQSLAGEKFPLSIDMSKLGKPPKQERRGLPFLRRS